MACFAKCFSFSRPGLVLDEPNGCPSSPSQPHWSQSERTCRNTSRDLVQPVGGPVAAAWTAFTSKSQSAQKSQVDMDNFDGIASACIQLRAGSSSALSGAVAPASDAFPPCDVSLNPNRSLGTAASRPLPTVVPLCRPRNFGTVSAPLHHSDESSEEAWVPAPKQTLAQVLLVDNEAPNSNHELGEFCESMLLSMQMRLRADAELSTFRHLPSAGSNRFVSRLSIGHNALHSQAASAFPSGQGPASAAHHPNSSQFVGSERRYIGSLEFPVANPTMRAASALTSRPSPAAVPDVPSLAAWSPAARAFPLTLRHHPPHHHHPSLSISRSRSRKGAAAAGPAHPQPLEPLAPRMIAASGLGAAAGGGGGGFEPHAVPVSSGGMLELSSRRAAFYDVTCDGPAQLVSDERPEGMGVGVIPRASWPAIGHLPLEPAADVAEGATLLPPAVDGPLPLPPAAALGASGSAQVPYRDAAAAAAASSGLQTSSSPGACAAQPSLHMALLVSPQQAAAVVSGDIMSAWPSVLSQPGQLHWQAGRASPSLSPPSCQGASPLQVLDRCATPPIAAALVYDKYGGGGAEAVRDDGSGGRLVGISSELQQLPRPPPQQPQSQTSPPGLGLPPPGLGLPQPACPPPHPQAALQHHSYHHLRSPFPVSGSPGGRTLRPIPETSDAITTYMPAAVGGAVGPLKRSREAPGLGSASSSSGGGCLGGVPTQATAPGGIPPQASPLGATQLPAPPPLAPAMSPLVTGAGPATADADSAPPQGPYLAPLMHPHPHQATQQAAGVHPALRISPAGSPLPPGSVQQAQAQVQAPLSAFPEKQGDATPLPHQQLREPPFRLPSQRQPLPHDGVDAPRRGRRGIARTVSRSVSWYGGAPTVHPDPTRVTAEVPVELRLCYALVDLLGGVVELRRMCTEPTEEAAEVSDPLLAPLQPHQQQQQQQRRRPGAARGERGPRGRDAPGCWCHEQQPSDGPGAHAGVPGGPDGGGGCGGTRRCRTVWLQGRWHGHPVAIKLLGGPDLEPHNSALASALAAAAAVHSGLARVYGMRLLPAAAAASTSMVDRTVAGGGGGSRGPLGAGGGVTDVAEEAIAALGLKPGDGVLAVIMEHCSMGSLEPLTRSVYSPFRPNRSWPAYMARRALLRTAMEVARALAHLHRYDITHGALRPGNVLLVPALQDRRNFCAKVTDVGLAASIMQIGAQSPGGCSSAAGCKSGRGGGGNASGPTAAAAAAAAALPLRSDEALLFVAPEAVAEPLKLLSSPAVDVFAFGVLLWALATSEAWPPEVLLEGPGPGTARQVPRWPSGAHPDLGGLYEACVDPDPEERPSMQQVLKELQLLDEDLRSERPKSRAAAAKGYAAMTAGRAAGGGGADWRMLPGYML